MKERRQGVALTLALVVLVLVEGFAALALAAATTRYRLTGDARLGVESRLFAASALATARIGHADALSSLADGEHRSFPPEPLGSGWVSRIAASRTGSLVRLVVGVERRRVDGWLIAARRGTLLLVLDPADTLRVLRSRPRF